jgi:hypothetical protein
MGMNFKNNCLLVNNFKNIVDYYKNKNEQFRLFCIVLYDNELHSEFYEYMMKNFSKFHTSTGKHLLFISTSEESKENSTYEETKINKYVLKNILKHLMINISLEELPIIIFNEGLHQGRFYYKKVNSSNIEDTFEKLTKISEVLWEKDKENYELPRFKGSLFTKLFKDTKFKEIEVVNNKVNGKYISLEEIFLNAIAPSLLINNLDDEEIKKEVKFQFEDIQKRTTNIDKITSYENILLLNILEEIYYL